MNKKFLWLFMLPLFLFLSIPNDAFAATTEYKNPKMDIIGYDSSDGSLRYIASCDACSELQNSYGYPEVIRIWFNSTLFNDNTEYTVSFRFRWVYNSMYDVWPQQPIMYDSYNQLTGVMPGASHVANGYTITNWTYTDGYQQSGYWFRYHEVTFKLKGDIFINLLGQYFLDIPFINNVDSWPEYYPLNFKLELDSIMISDSLSETDTIINNAVDKLIEQDAINQHSTNTKLDVINDTNLSIWDTIKSILSNIITFPQKIGEKIGELLNDLSIWDTITNIYNFITNIPFRIGEIIVDKLNYLFIPSEDFYETTIDKYYDDITDSLGMLWFPFDFIENFVSKYVSLETNPIINIPNIKDPVYGVTLIEARSFNIQEIFQHGSIGTVYNIYMIFAGAFIVVLFINFLIRKFNHIINGNESGAA